MARIQILLPIKQSNDVFFMHLAICVNKPFVIATDKSNYQLGAVITKEIDLMPTAAVDTT